MSVGPCKAAAATPYRRRLEQSRILVVPVVERPGVPVMTSVDEREGGWA